MNGRIFFKRLAVVLAMTVGASAGMRVAAGAEGVPSESNMEDNEDAVQVSERGIPTLGGMQFWADRSWLRGWKIQQHVYTHHCRLLDPQNGRHFSGSLEDCERALKQVKRAKRLTADRGTVVILIHGIVRSSRSFAAMAASLRHSHDVVIGFEYPSTRVPIDQSAEYLHLLIESLTAAQEIDLVVHSMGGLVVRSYLNKHVDPRLHRLVMLGTPNRGAEIADLFRTNALYRWVTGPAGQQLVTDSGGTIASLPVPAFEFAVIAGGDGKDGYNPLLPGDDDGTVTVRSVQLPGAADSLLVPRLHTMLMRDETAITATRHFLRHGRFERNREPMPVKE
jgi:pimeloyl-ACP methyl ester carboxylesterase